jgi:hypothetical protein
MYETEHGIKFNPAKANWSPLTLIEKEQTM